MKLTTKNQVNHPSDLTLASISLAEFHQTNQRETSVAKCEHYEEDDHEAVLDVLNEIVWEVVRNLNNVQGGFTEVENVEQSMNLHNDAIKTESFAEELKHIRPQHADDTVAWVDMSLRRQAIDNETPCMICDYIESDTDTKINSDVYFCHLVDVHDLMVDNVTQIADVRRYALYWKKRFQEEALKQICSNSKVYLRGGNTRDKKEFYLLCDSLIEERQIRQELQLNRLNKLLLRQEFERNDTEFVGLCPFCTRTFKGNRSLLFDHMSKDHNFKVGHPDNIVNVVEFVNTIHERLNSGKCLFCDKKFELRSLLREHMRKKGHRRLNPKDQEFDKYYMINYLEVGKTWQTLQSEPDHFDCNEDWSGWVEESELCLCFFCNVSHEKACDVYNHMKQIHMFDFCRIREDMQLSFYQQVKMTNYIRREMLLQQSKERVDPNVAAAKIWNQLTTSTNWNRQQYYFPTFECDAMLCQIEDKDGLIEPEDNFVVGENGIDCLRLVNNSIIGDLLAAGFFEIFI